MDNNNSDLGQHQEAIAQKFPVHCLPPVIGNMVTAIAAATQTTETLAACCCLGAVSASIGKGLQVESDTAGRVTRGNLYILASARSGTGKSNAARHALKPIEQKQAEMIARWREHTKPQAIAHERIIKGQLAGWEKKALDHAKRDGAGMQFEHLPQVTRLEKELAEVQMQLQPPAIYVEDCTSEILAVTLLQNRERVASYSTDAGAIVNNLLGAHRKKDQTDDTLYLKAYSGEPVDVRRIGRESVSLQSPCIAATWLVQPDKVERLLANVTLTEGGLMPRMLVCHSHCEPQRITQALPRIPAYHQEAYEEQLTSLIDSFHSAENPLTVTSTAEALDVMIEFHNEIVDRRAGEIADMDHYAARWAENAWRIAVCLHAAEYGSRAAELTLSGDTARNAIGIMRFFSASQEDIMRQGRAEAQDDKLGKVRVLLGQNPDGMPARELLVRKVVHTAREAEYLLGLLLERGEVSAAKVETAGRPKTIYRLADMPNTP